MSRPELPPRLASALDAVRAATLRVLEAASGDDAEELRDAVERRGIAIEYLAPVMKDLERRLGAEERRALETESEALLRQGRDAEAALASRRDLARGAIVSFGKGAAAVRGYAFPAGEPGGLDHSA